eukprot:TRINITY_DN828_c0_g2_i1.p1 TRINITY_DN828_c0_g2~~TRINITY_DN828_c0_g2_i1.p1  ORF type:complete len:161 (+),score=39.23 TRINITY_DN828_c0_g2_i1:26-484(+)
MFVLGRPALSAIAGILFGVAWLIFIDGVVYQAHFSFSPSVTFPMYLPGIVGTIGLVMANIVKVESLSATTFLFNDGMSGKIRAWLLVSFVVSFGAIAAAIWIMIGVFMPPNNRDPNTEWPGIAMVIQTSIMFLSSITLIWAKSTGSSEYDSL